MNKSFQPQRRTVLKRIFQYSALGLFTLLSPLVGSLEGRGRFIQRLSWRSHLLIRLVLLVWQYAC